MNQITKRIKTRNLFFIATLFLLWSFCVTKAWASVTFLKTDDASLRIEEPSRSHLYGLNASRQNNSRAPEPTTIALFGSGLMGFLLHWVRKSYKMAKRGFDILSALIGLLLFSPVLMIIAILVKLTSKGPVLYRQTRVGRNGILFDIYKFRTMKVNAEKETGPVWAKDGDNRLTPIGGFLRKTHLDETPQFLNVLKGDMSLIGPRPERPVFVEKLKKEIKDYEKRLTVKPGITGLAQVWHRYDETIEDVKKKIKYDLTYIKKMCLWTDVQIVLRTFRVILTGEGAR